MKLEQSTKFMDFWMNAKDDFLMIKVSLFSSFIMNFSENELWTLYQHVFNCMPMSALIAEKIFCTHGGISEDLISWKQYDRITRPTDITDVGLLTDLVWADPINDKKKYEPSIRGISQVSVFNKLIIKKINF